MSRFLIAAGAAVFLVTSVIAGPASAANQKETVAGVMNNATAGIDFSARRYHGYRHYGYRHYPRYYGYRYSPYYAYAPGPYYYGPRYYRRPAFPFWPFF